MEDHKRINKTILKLQDLYVHYRDTPVIRGVSVKVHEGEIVGVVGESGSGKSTLIYATLGILGEGGRITSGDIRFDDRSMLSLPREELRKLRGNAISLIAQDPVSAFHPLKKIRAELRQLVNAHGGMTQAQAEAAMLSAMEKISLRDGKTILNKHAFALSGGMCQRTAIAMSMVLQPKLLFADEPTSALDVTVQKQVVEEMMKIRNDSGTAIFIVSHNMGVISYMADTIYVMMSGLIMECGTKEDVLRHTAHPYTKSLIRAIPRLDAPAPRAVAAREPDRQARGCPFKNVCDCRQPVCEEEIPQMKEVSAGHFVRCCYLES